MPQIPQEPLRNMLLQAPSRLIGPRNAALARYTPNLSVPRAHPRDARLPAPAMLAAAVRRLDGRVHSTEGSPNRLDGKRELHALQRVLGRVRACLARILLLQARQEGRKERNRKDKKRLTVERKTKRKRSSRQKNERKVKG